MDLWQIAAPQFFTYFLIMTRLGSLFLATPFFSSDTFPAQIKVGLSLILSLALLPSIPVVASLPTHPLAFVTILMKEIFIGVVIGYSCQIVFYGIQMAGSIIGHLMMFQMVNVVDPQSDSQITVIGQVEFLVAILLFLTIDGHHWLLKAMVDSFELVPLGAVNVQMPQMLKEFEYLFGQLFVIAFQVAAPAAGTLFLTHFTMGLIARIMPQMNVFVVGMPLFVGVGLLVTGLSLGSSYLMFEKYFINMVGEIYTLLRLMR